MPRFLGVLAVLFLGWLAVDVWCGWAVSPPKGVTHLSDFAKHMKPPRKLSRIQFDGQELIVWEGQLKPFPAVSSGPACYVFDLRGNLLEWSSETGEGGRVSEILAATRSAKGMALEEVIASLAATN